ncbi:amine oxidase [Larkinella rosea]|uniref:Amine oxidase n=2 Tax=Larkinella rosea TaxID=2025312 RepID=A0A3P1C8Y0_9BACT|nr:amine oxidase [Larkinella rosea]RRB09314.1 amine oxidase [Larkinella rosea]
MSVSFSNPFRSYWMAGYECTDKLNAWGNRVDFLQITGHLDCLDEDYGALASFGIQTVREGIRWSQVETRPYHYDWQTLAHLIRRGRVAGIQQCWDLCHFGFPDDLTPLHPMFARRFAALCRNFALFYRSIDADSPLIVTPINEVSFLSWLGGDARGTSPYCIGQGWEVKYHLMRAYIEGVAALREVDAGVRILTTEPLINRVAPLNATDEQIAQANRAHQNQFQATDMLCGRMCPELGGRAEYLDLVGLNFYYNNQWICDTCELLPWLNEQNDPRWQPLRTLLHQVYQRYQRPLVLSETSHPGQDRPRWIQFIANECAAAWQQGLPLWGLCLYPIIDRPDWDQLTPWHRSGLWDAELKPDGTPTQYPPRRVLNQPYAHALRQAQRQLATLQNALRANRG